MFSLLLVWSELLDSPLRILLNWRCRRRKKNLFRTIWTHPRACFFKNSSSAVSFKNCLCHVAPCSANPSFRAWGLITWRLTAHKKCGVVCVNWKNITELLIMCMRGTLRQIFRNIYSNSGKKCESTSPYLLIVLLISCSDSCPCAFWERCGASGDWLHCKYVLLW